MNDNFDDLLASIGIEQNTTSEPLKIDIQETAVHEEDTSPLSDDDFSEILSSNGFSEFQEEDSLEDDYDDEEEEEEEPVESPILAMAEADTVEEEESHEESSQEEEDDNQVVNIITPNLSTFSTDESNIRFSGAEWYGKIISQTVLVAGLGGIGSWTSFLLARMSPYVMTLYDNDTVDATNMSGQLYGHGDIGKPKAGALYEFINKYASPGSVHAFKERFTSMSESCDIMICGFDNMVARRDFFQVWEYRVRDLPEDARKKCLYIDGRLSIDTLQVFSITGEDAYNRKKYREEFLFTDSEAEETVCSLKQTSYLANMIASVIVNIFTNFIANQCNSVIPYKVPFFTEYNAQFMMFKTEY